MILWVNLMRAFLIQQQSELENRQRQQDIDDRDFSME
jgi:hypothetical protein